MPASSTAVIIDLTMIVTIKVRSSGKRSAVNGWDIMRDHRYADPVSGSWNNVYPAALSQRIISIAGRFRSS
jgi:hypothetical protein